MAQKPSELLPAYLVVGPDEYKANHVVARLEGRLDQGFAAFNLQELEAPNVPEPQELLMLLNTLPVGDTRRVIVIRSAERLPKATSEAVVGYLDSNPNRSCTLCLVAKSLAKNTRLYKAVAALGPKAIIDCSAKKPWQQAEELVRQARTKYAIQLDQDAARELVSRVGDSTLLQETQLATLAELCRADGVIHLADVEARVARVAEVKPWDLLDAISARNAARALSLYQLMDASSEVALVTLLVRRLRELMCAQALLARGEARSLAKTLGKQGWQVKNYTSWAQGFAQGELEEALLACRVCDRALKSGADARIAFTQLVLEICKPKASSQGFSA